MGMAKSKTGKDTGAKASKADSKSARRDEADAKPIDKGSVALPASGIDEAWLKKNTKGMTGVAPSLGVPLFVFSSEAQDVAGFVVRYWKPEIEDGEVVRPGLESAVIKSQPEKFGLHTASEIIELRRRVDDAQTEFLLASKAKKNASSLLEKAQALLDVWTGALEWYLDDGVEDDKDAQLAAVAAANESLDTIDGVANALKDYGALVGHHARELDGVLDFDPKSVDEGAKLREQLREINAALEDNPEARRALAKRNNLLALLFARVKTVRTAARLRFVGPHAEIARQVTSSYQRRARAAARRREAAKPPAT